MDPQLSGTSVSEYRLLSGSPAIDTANCASAPADDFSGDLRPQGAGCDIGADEYSSSLFADVPSDHWARSWIETLYAAGITSGCGTNPLTFCPDAPVTRAEMAVFLERGMNGAAYNPPAATGTVFTDISADYWAAAWVEQLFADGITAGCGPDLYCPNDYVTRDQMAIFLLRAKYGSAHPTARNWRIFRRTHRLLGGRVDRTTRRRRHHGWLWQRQLLPKPAGQPRRDGSLPREDI
ncbi:S-layer homology domain-containing protein [Candidatus Villigracilis affinis]|uniref:S-layer homology domain-containing protein n=1 Tax=Candidatus Villigracilis affinis TaxID=3140682 RepID=UPI0031E94B85